MGYLEFKLNHPTEITREGVGGGRRGRSGVKHVRKTAHGALILFWEASFIDMNRLYSGANSPDNAKQMNHYFARVNLSLMKRQQTQQRAFFYQEDFTPNMI